MEEERSRFQEVIGKMEARLGEQSRLLEQVGPVSPALGSCTLSWPPRRFSLSLLPLALQGLPPPQPPEVPPAHPVQPLPPHH